MRSLKRNLFPGFRVLAFTVCIPLLGCGSGQNQVQFLGAELSTRTQDQETWASLETIVKIGETRLPELLIPVVHPQTRLVLGELQTYPLADGTNSIAISVSLNQVAKLDSSLGLTLPNGREIPRSLGAEAGSLVGIPILERSRIYVGGGTKKDLFLGVALSIDQLDSVLGANPLALNAFFPVQFSPELSGLYGLFTAPRASNGSSGIAFFARRSNLQKPTESLRVSTIDESTEGRAEIQKLSRYRQLRLNRFLRQKTELRLR